MKAAVARELHYTDVSALYTAIGEGHVSARHVVQRLLAELGGIDQAEEDLAERSTPTTMLRRPRSSDDVGDDVIERLGAVDLRLANPEQVQVRTVEK